MLRPDEASVEHVFGDASSLASDNQDVQLTDEELETLPVKDSHHAMLLLRLSLFHVGQLIDRGELSEQSCTNYQRSTSCLLGILRALAASPSERDELVGDYFKCAVSHPSFLEALAPGGGRLVAGLFAGTVEAAAKAVPRRELAPLRRRLLLQARALLAGGLEGCPELLRVLGLFQFDVQEAGGLLRQAAASPTELLWLPGDPARLSPVGLLLALLLRKVFLEPCRGALERGAVLQGVVEGAARHVVSLQDARLEDVSQLEGGLLQFLKKYPHYLEHVPEELLRGLLGNPDRSGTAAKLCVLLVGRSARLAAVFSELALERAHVLESAMCLFAVLSAALAHGPGAVDAALLRRVYERYRGPICRAVVQSEDVPAWVTRHVDAVVALIDTCMGAETCRELCARVAEEGAVRDTTHQRLLHAVFARSGREGDAWCAVLLGACRDETVLHRLDQLVLGLQKGAALAGTRSLAAVREDGRWWELARLALARGMQGSPRLLAALAELCGVLYEDGSDHPRATELFSALAAHPGFLPSLMGTAAGKRPVLELWLALTKKAPAVMSPAHVPTLLGAYGASLSLADQLVLLLLRRYEGGGVSLEGCRPYLWGHAAAAHYGARPPLAAALWQQPSVAQVLELLSEDKVTSTLQRFPLDRPLHVEGQPHADQPRVYDPAFFLPLLSHLLSPENEVRVSKVHGSGALALCIAALSSDHRRRAPCRLPRLARFYCHVEASWQSKEKQLWLHVVDALRRAAPGGPEVPQLPSVVTLHLAHATRLISNPSSPLGAALHNYVCLRPALRLDDVPDFLRLFHSRDVHHREHRRFILELLQHGIRREADFHLMRNAFVYKMLMTFYSSVLADDSCKVLILQVLQSTAQLPAAAAALVSSHGLLPWLDGVVARLDSRHTRASYAVLRLLCRLWASLAARPGSAAGPLLRLLLRVLPGLQPELPAHALAEYTAALSGAAASSPPGVLAYEDVAAVLRYCRPALGPLADLHALLAFGGRFVKYKPCRVASTKKGFARSNLIQAHLHLRSFVLAWLERTPHPD
ncbi:uncharacterized protein LOC134542936 [Bacillus rossius redtenbacheri]|uniref:uncharacterized protein LOC134542936 n=1 Tax=Bacillus rossius redtenbacheri TaxID=93214 RepID=UPI002FDD12E9